MVEDMVAKGELDMAEATANQPISRLGHPDEIAAAVLWLCSPAAGFVLGAALPVDGGHTARCLIKKSEGLPTSRCDGTLEIPRLSGAA